VDIYLLDSKISSKLGEILFESGSGNLKNARKNHDDLLTLMNRKEMVIGSNADFSKQLETLQNRLNELEASLSEPIDSINAIESGFFVSSVDGYETVLSADDLERYTPEFLDSVTLDKSKNEGKIGKIVSDYTWYIAAPLTANQSLSYKKGDIVTIKTQLNSNPFIKVKVEQINLSADRERSVILFSCQEMNDELATMRSGAMTLISGEYSGLKVPKSALRVSENQTGVYVISGMELKFVSTKVLYQTDDYVICEKADTNQNSQLRLYDKVVVKGRNLYDGKIIN
jgi:putative membrane fusion protein